MTVGSSTLHEAAAMPSDVPGANPELPNRPLVRGMVVEFSKYIAKLDTAGLFSTIPLDNPKYLSTIKRPIALDMMVKHAGKYSTIMMLYLDFMVMIENCKTFFGEYSIQGIKADETFCAGRKYLDDLLKLYEPAAYASLLKQRQATSTVVIVDEPRVVPSGSKRFRDKLETLGPTALLNVRMSGKVKGLPNPRRVFPRVVHEENCASPHERTIGYLKMVEHNISSICQEDELPISFRTTDRIAIGPHWSLESFTKGLQCDVLTREKLARIEGYPSLSDSKLQPSFQPSLFEATFVAPVKDSVESLQNDVISAEADFIKEYMSTCIAKNQ